MLVSQVYSRKKNRKPRNIKKASISNLNPKNVLQSQSLRCWLSQPEYSETIKLFLQCFSTHMYQKIQFFYISGACSLFINFQKKIKTFYALTFLQTMKLIIQLLTKCCSIGHQVLPAQPTPRGVEDFHRGGRYPMHMPLLTYLTYLQPKGIGWQVRFVYQALLKNIISNLHWF